MIYIELHIMLTILLIKSKHSILLLGHSLRLEVKLIVTSTFTRCGCWMKSRRSISTRWIDLWTESTLLLFLELFEVLNLFSLCVSVALLATVETFESPWSRLDLLQSFRFSRELSDASKCLGQIRLERTLFEFLHVFLHSTDGCLWARLECLVEIIQEVFFASLTCHLILRWNILWFKGTLWALIDLLELPQERTLHLIYLARLIESFMHRHLSSLFALPPNSDLLLWHRIVIHHAVLLSIPKLSFFWRTEIPIIIGWRMLEFRWWDW